MNKFFIALSIGLFFCTISFAQQIRVACIGNGLTYGTGINKRELNSYPAQLQRILGDNYLVRNFGVEGSTIYKDDEKSFRKSAQYQASLDFEPEIIIFSFGLEEAKITGNGQEVNFVKDYKEMVFRYFNLPTALRTIVLTPAPSFDTFGTLDNRVIKNTIMPAIEEVAFSTSSEIVNIYSLLSSGGANYADNINLSAIGANKIARNIYEILNYRSEHDFNIIYQTGLENTKSNFHGYTQYDFELFGWSCKLVSPRHTALGRPWIWRSGHWGDYTDLDQQLLQRGIHVAYIDTEGLFGNSEAEDRWFRLYDFMTKGGMDKKVSIESYGIGSLEAMNWSVNNKDKIKAIYLDEPLLDLNSWPGGTKKASEEIDIRKKVLRAHGIKNSKKEEPFMFSPVNSLEKWNENQIPFFVVYSKLNGKIVPEENIKKFLSVNAVEKLTTEHPKEGVFESFGLEDPSELSGFILDHTGYPINFAEIPSAGFEFRSAAGWKSGADWWDNHREISARIKTTSPHIIFLGNSITQGIGGGRTLLQNPVGGNVFQSAFSKYPWENAGISGDRIGQMMFRITDGEFVKGNPRLIVITAGVNDFPEESAENVFKGIQKLVALVERTMPDTKILILGPLPVGIEANHPWRKKFEDVHAKMEKATWGDFVTYRKFYSEFLTADKKLNPTFYAKDGVHLTLEGYKRWAELLQPEVNKILSYR